MVSFLRVIAPGIREYIGILEAIVIKLGSQRAICHKHINQLEPFEKIPMVIFTSKLVMKAPGQTDGYHIKSIFGKITITKNYPRG